MDNKSIPPSFTIYNSTSCHKSWEIRRSSSIALILLLHAFVNAANIATGHATSASEAAGGVFFTSDFYDVDFFFLVGGGEVHSVSVMCWKFTEQIKKQKQEKGVCHVEDTGLALIVCHDTTCHVVLGPALKSLSASFVFFFLRSWIYDIKKKLLLLTKKKKEKGTKYAG